MNEMNEVKTCISIITSGAPKKKKNLRERLSAFCNKIFYHFYASCEKFSAITFSEIEMIDTGKRVC